MTLEGNKRKQSAALWPAIFEIALFIAILPSGGYAADQPMADQPVADQPAPVQDQQATPVDPIADYFAHWFDRVDAAQAS